MTMDYPDAEDGLAYLRGVVHDLNNLLAVVCGAAEAIGQRADSGELHLDTETRGDLAAITGAVARGRVMLRAGLRRDAASALDLDPHAAVVDDVLRSLQSTLRHACGAAIDLRFDLGAPGSRVAVDRGTIERILLNLVANARDAMTQGGTVTLRSLAPSRDPDGHVAIEIRDGGPGIAPDILARLGETYFTTKPPGQGTGLGLATVRRLLGKTGGVLDISSSAGEGTCVRLRLPCLRRGTVLLVEDDAMLLHLVARALTRAGWHVVPALSAEVALALLDDIRQDDIVALVTDLSLPSMGGAPLVAAIRARLGRSRLPAVIVSGFADPARGHADLADSDIAFIAKPYAMAELTRLMDELVPLSETPAWHDAGLFR